MGTIGDLLAEGYRAWDDAATLARVGEELEGRNRLDHARRLLERAVELRPGNAEVWKELAYANYRALRSAEGDEAFRRGIAATGSDRLRIAFAAFLDGEEADRLTAAAAASPDPVVQAAVAHRRLLTGGGAPELDRLRALARAHPERDEVREILVWALLTAKGRGLVLDLDLEAEALPLAARRVRERPDAIGPRWPHLFLLQARKDLDGVLEATADALAHFPDDETLMQFRARAWRDRGDAERAAQWFLRAIGAKPSFVGARVELGRLYEAQGRPDLAAEVFREIPRANREYAMGSVSLALFLGRRGEWEEAERVFLEAWPRVPEFHRSAVRGNPAAQDLLARDAVKAVLGP